MKINDNFAINLIMRKLAIDAVKRKLKAQGGYRPWHVPFRDLQALARQHLEDREEELVAQAKEKWRKMNEPRTRVSVVGAAPVRSSQG